jgi:CSLREA domain-containing protein
MRLGAVGVLAATVLAGLALTACEPAELVGDKTADTDDGRCDQDCSLREAVLAANARPGRDVVRLPAGMRR